MNKGWLIGGGLIGLVVTFGILAVLYGKTTSATVQTGTAAENQVKNTANRANRQTITTALSAYKFENQSYPCALSELVPKYLSTVPKDQTTGENFEYSEILGGSDYLLCFVLAPKGSGKECVMSSGVATTEK